MGALAVISGHTMEQKDLTAATTLYFLGGLLFLHRAYLGDYRPTALTICLGAVFVGALYAFPGSLVVLVPLLVVLAVWVTLVVTDAGRVPDLVERKNAEILEKFK